MAITTGASASVVSAPQVPGGDQVVPVLQAQDGSFIGTTCRYCAPGYGTIVAFDASGNVRWTVSGGNRDSLNCVAFLRFPHRLAHC
jgi:hypothetical protein